MHSTSVMTLDLFSRIRINKCLQILSHIGCGYLPKSRLFSTKSTMTKGSEAKAQDLGREELYKSMEIP